MNIKRAVTSLVIICSLALSLTSGISTAYATELRETTSDEDSSEINTFQSEFEEDETLVVFDDTSDDETTDSGGGHVPVVPISEGLDTSNQYDAVEYFVVRLYRYTLNRSYDPIGFEFWTARLRNRTTNGWQIAFDFFFSNEFIRDGHNDSDFIFRLYRALMGREPDSDGRQFWLDLMNRGMPRQNVFAGFVNSPEFERLSNEAGIERGTFVPPAFIAPPQPPAPPPPLPPPPMVDLSGRIIFLDAGHGDGWNSINGYSEGTTMRILAERVRTRLQERGATVHMLRPGTANVPLQSRVAQINITTLRAIRGTHTNPATLAEIDRLINVMQNIVNNPSAGTDFMNVPFQPGRVAHPDMVSIFELQNNPIIRDNYLVISLHSNATGVPTNPAVHGANAFVISNTHVNARHYFGRFSFESQSRQFGGIALRYITPPGLPNGFHNRGVVGSNYFMLREHNIPAVLMENGFHTNLQDRTKLSDDGFISILADGYIRAIIEYFD